MPSISARKGDSEGISRLPSGCGRSSSRWGWRRASWKRRAIRSRTRRSAKVLLRSTGTTDAAAGALELWDSDPFDDCARRPSSPVASPTIRAT